MIYDGVLSRLIHVDLGQMEHALRRQLGKKTKAIELNLAALEAGDKYAADHLQKRDPYWIEPAEQDRRDDPRRGERRRRSWMHDGRRDRRRLVSDHAVLVAARGADRVHEEVPDRQGDRQGDLRDRAGRGRDCVDRDGGRRRVGGRARDDVHVRSWHLADGRVRRPRVLRGGPGRRVGHPARRALDGAADAHRAGGHPDDRDALARRHEARSC